MQIKMSKKIRLLYILLSISALPVLILTGFTTPAIQMTAVDNFVFISVAGTTSYLWGTTIYGTLVIP